MNKKMYSVLLTALLLGSSVSTVLPVKAEALSTSSEKLILGDLPIVPVTSFYNLNQNPTTYKMAYPTNQFHNPLHQRIYQYMLNPANEVNVHNTAVRLHGGITVNNCAFFASEVLRRQGVSIQSAVGNVEQLQGILTRIGFQRDFNLRNLKPGDIAFTERFTHTFIFMGWVNQGRYDYAYVVDNQARMFGGEVYHIRKLDSYEPSKDTDKTAFFMYRR